MPMDFPDLNSLVKVAKKHNFRDLNPNESEASYRIALSKHVRSIDVVESQEIRLGIGHDKWTKEQRGSLFDYLFNTKQ